MKYFAATRDDGPYYIGPCDSKELALEEAKTEYADEIKEGAEIHLGIGREVTIMIDGDSVLEKLADQWFDELYEDALDCWCDKIPKEKKEELGVRLSEVLHKWLDENNEQHTFTCIDCVGSK